MPQHRPTDQQLADAQAKVARLRKRQRSEDTRRKILIGALMQARAEASDEFRKGLIQALDGYLTDDRDRRLFDLPPKA